VVIEKKEHDMSRTKIPILLDSGTSYSKIFYLDTGEYSICLTRKLKERIDRYSVVAATGHNAARFSDNVTNELLALAKGAHHYLHEDGLCTVIDCGSRDIKYITIDHADNISIDWNTECGAFCGQIIELLTHYFNFQTDTIRPASKPIAVPCGILGMTTMFDLISDNIEPDTAFARFIKGMAENIYRFAGKPTKLYLSGGLCDNSLFLKSFDKTEVIPLGRFVLLDGLKQDLTQS
jgi:activator of 2-hydroxyglutaryl-CoA dehydratase